MTNTKCIPDIPFLEGYMATTHHYVNGVKLPLNNKTREHWCLHFWWAILKLCMSNGHRSTMHYAEERNPPRAIKKYHDRLQVASNAFSSIVLVYRMCWFYDWLGMRWQWKHEEIKYSRSVVQHELSPCAFNVSIFYGNVRTQILPLHTWRAIGQGWIFAVTWILRPVRYWQWFIVREHWGFTTFQRLWPHMENKFNSAVFSPFFTFSE